MFFSLFVQSPLGSITQLVVVMWVGKPCSNFLSYFPLVFILSSAVSQVWSSSLVVVQCCSRSIFFVLSSGSGDVSKPGLTLHDRRGVLVRPPAAAVGVVVPGVLLVSPVPQ